MKTLENFNVIRDKEWVYKTMIENTPKQHRTAPGIRGFSLVELMVVVTILALLTLIALPSFTMLKDLAKNARAETEIRAMEKGFALYVNDNYGLPAGLAAIPGAVINDPWGNPYEYWKITGPGDANAYSPGVPGTDQINTDYDLYSKGKDGQSLKGLSDPTCADDIIRCGNLGKVVLADKY
jgi:general secretion pathway protein G